MNRFIIIGRLTGDPEMRYTEGRTAIARFNIAVDRKYKKAGEPTADYFNVTAFGKTAEVIEKYVFKGTKLAVTGRVENNNFTNSKGEKVYATTVIAEEIEFCEAKTHGSSQKGEANGEGFMNIPNGIDEEIPFN